jgi:hypothetical protein
MNQHSHLRGPVPPTFTPTRLVSDRDPGLRRGRFLPVAAAWLLIAAGLLADAAPGWGAEWAGRAVDRDGVVTMQNPAAPMNPDVTIEPEALWTLGGHSEAEEELFGVLRGLLTDADGNIYLLDVQLSEIRVFDADGAYLRTIGRDGEGPGEFRRPRALFFTPGGEVAVVQLMPGRVVLLTPEGDPAGEFSLPENEGGGMRMLFDGADAGEHVAIFSRTQNFQPGVSSATNTLATYDAGGREVARLYERTTEMDMANFVFDETKNGFITWKAGVAGSLFLIPEWGEYEIHQWSAAGQESKVIRREYDHLMRTAAEKERARSSFVIRGPVDPKIIVSDHHPDIAQLYPRQDGSLWVLTSRGARQAPEGSLGTFDVFDAQGRFDHRVTVMGEGDPTEDLFYFEGDRLYVLRHYTEAFDSMVGGNDAAEDEGDDPEPMKVICYRLP